MGDILEFQTGMEYQQICWIENEVLVHLLVVHGHSCGCHKQWRQKDASLQTKTLCQGSVEDLHQLLKLILDMHLSAEKEE